MKPHIANLFVELSAAIMKCQIAINHEHADLLTRLLERIPRGEVSPTAITQFTTYRTNLALLFEAMQLLNRFAKTATQATSNVLEPPA